MGLLCDSSGDQCVLVYHFISLFHLFLAAVFAGFAHIRKTSLARNGGTHGDDATRLLYLVAGFLVVMSACLWVIV